MSNSENQYDTQAGDSLTVSGICQKLEKELSQKICFLSMDLELIDIRAYHPQETAFKRYLSLF